MTEHCSIERFSVGLPENDAGVYKNQNKDPKVALKYLNNNEYVHVYKCHLIHYA